MLIIKALYVLVRVKPGSKCCLFVFLYALLSTISACTLLEHNNRDSKIHLTAAANTTLQGSDISPSVELGLYSIYGRYGYKGTKIFDFAEQLLVGYQNNLFNPAPTIITSYSNNAGFLGLGLSHEIEREYITRQRLGGRVMFFGPTHTSELPNLYFEIFGYFGGRWSLSDEGSEGLFGLGVRLHYRLNERRLKRRMSTRTPAPPLPPLTPEQQHHMRMWRIKNIRKIIARYQAHESLVEELERLEQEEKVYQDSLKAIK